MKQEKKTLDELASQRILSAGLIRCASESPMSGETILTQQMQNYEKLFSVGRTLIKERLFESNLKANEIADRAFCDRQSFRDFIVSGTPISGIDWRNIVNELGINIDKWLDIADAKPSEVV